MKQIDAQGNELNTGGVPVYKAMSISQGDAFKYEDLGDALEYFKVKPMLLTSLFKGSTKTKNLRGDVYKFDRKYNTVTVPEGKAYSEYGKDIDKNTYNQMMYGVGSYGIRYNVSPEDIDMRREPGTDSLMTVNYLTSEMQEKAENAFGLLDELIYAKCLFEDKNYVGGGPFTEYNYHTDLEGGARASATDMTLGTGTTDTHSENFREQVELLKQNVMTAGQNATSFICICGDTFFNKRAKIEMQLSFFRELRSNLDLASMPIPRMPGSATVFPYANFTGSFDGITYINYGAAIVGGTKLVSDADAYLIAGGVNDWLERAYAPCKTMTYVNTVAQEMYGGTNTDERQGITTYWESNNILVNRRPKFVTHLTTS